MSEEWNKFIDSFFGKARFEYDGGVDISTVIALEDEERLKAEGMLIEALQDGGYYAILGLREMQSQKAISVMKAMIVDIDPLRQIEMAVALNELENTDEYTHYIVSILIGDYHWTLRRTAARRLAIYEDDFVVEALFTAICDPDYLVRYAAAESLLIIHGLDPELSSHKRLFRLLSSKPEPIDKSTTKIETKDYKKAAELLQRMLSEK